MQVMIQHVREPHEQQRLVETIRNSVKNDPRRKEVFAMSKTIAEALQEEATVKALRSTLLRQLRQKFKKVPPDARRIINQTENLRTLNRWLDRVLTAENWEDMQIG